MNDSFNFFVSISISMKIDQSQLIWIYIHFHQVITVAARATKKNISLKKLKESGSWIRNVSGAIIQSDSNSNRKRDNCIKMHSQRHFNALILIANDWSRSREQFNVALMILIICVFEDSSNNGELKCQFVFRDIQVERMFIAFNYFVVLWQQLKIL